MATYEMLSHSPTHQLQALRPNTGFDCHKQLLIRRLPVSRLDLESCSHHVGSMNATHTTKYLCLGVPKRRIHVPIMTSPLVPSLRSRADTTLEA